VRKLKSGSVSDNTELTFRLSRAIFTDMSQVVVGVGDAASRPLRADARRNREKVIAAARAAFAERGRDAQMDDVARRAEVGVGTVYRHFPTKEALLEALSEDTFARIAEQARGKLGREDAWAAFVELMWQAGDALAGDRALTEVMAARAPGAPCPGQLELADIVAELIRRAQATGEMRPDVVAEDVPMLMCGVGSATARPHPCDDAWRRHLAILIDGLRASAASGRLAR
jgi:AcrR family transcriptional regulator